MYKCKFAYFMLYNSVIFCDVLPRLAQGNIEYSNLNRQLETIASYRCGTGYRLDGNNQRVCLANELWSGSQPVCIRELI